MSLPTQLIKLQIGPVQEFITQARSTRDLWSGSYLLTWLMAAGIKHLASVGGKGALVYPSLEFQPLVEYFGNFSAPDCPRSKLLMPNIPNLMVAEVRCTTEQACEYSQETARVIRAEWSAITESCLTHMIRQGLLSPAGTAEDRFRRQAELHLNISWQVSEVEAAGSYAQSYAKCSWQLDAVRHTREFLGWREGGWIAGRGESKDCLSGREEAVVGGDSGVWWDSHVRNHSDARWRTLFRERRKAEPLGAVTLIKRTWHWAHLCRKHKLPAMHSGVDGGCFPFPSTLHIGTHDPQKNEDDEERALEDADRLECYFAVLALDGDQIGKWVSGCKLSPTSPHRQDFQKFHRDFSQKLSAFALNVVGGIVGKCQGRLIYAGGDDVLALLPADRAVECAFRLRRAYRYCLKGFFDEESKRPEMSGGIAIAHFQNPLQDVVRAAQSAERRAKNELGRAALSISLLKRSGEIIQWGTQWESYGLRLYFHLLKGTRLGTHGGLSARFPHAVAELINPYLSGHVKMSVSHEFDACAADVLLADLRHALRRQGPDWSGKEEALRLARAFFAFQQAKRASAGDELARSLLGLCQTLAFLRASPDEAEPPPLAAASSISNA